MIVEGTRVRYSKEYLSRVPKDVISSLQSLVGIVYKARNSGYDVTDPRNVFYTVIWDNIGDYLDSINEEYVESLEANGICIIEDHSYGCNAEGFGRLIDNECYEADDLEQVAGE